MSEVKTQSIPTQRKKKEGVEHYQLEITAVVEQLLKFEWQKEDIFKRFLKAPEFVEKYVLNFIKNVSKVVKVDINLAYIIFQHLDEFGYEELVDIQQFDYSLYCDFVRILQYSVVDWGIRQQVTEKYKGVESSLLNVPNYLGWMLEKENLVELYTNQGKINIQVVKDCYLQASQYAYEDYYSDYMIGVENERQALNLRQDSRKYWKSKIKQSLTPNILQELSLKLSTNFPFIQDIASQYAQGEGSIEDVLQGQNADTYIEKYSGIFTCITDILLEEYAYAGGGLAAYNFIGLYIWIEIEELKAYLKTIKGTKKLNIAREQVAKLLNLFLPTGWQVEPEIFELIAQGRDMQTFEHNGKQYILWHYRLQNVDLDESYLIGVNAVGKLDITDVFDEGTSIRHYAMGNWY